jgi:predicted dinucleotide-binding enzyme
MKIGILGSGNIGGTLGKKWVNEGHEIIFGVRNTGSTKVRTLLTEIGSAASAELVEDAIKEAEVILLAIPHAAVAEVVQKNASSMRGKIIIDATNKFGSPVVNNIEVISNHVVGAKIFRSFNSLGWEVFADPKFGEITADHFYCGPDDETRSQVEQLIAGIGMNPIYVGGLQKAALVDSLGTLWITLVSQHGMGRHLAFKMLT